MSYYILEVGCDLPPRNEVEKFFEPSVRVIVEGIKEIAADTDPSANTVGILFYIRR